MRNLKLTIEYDGTNYCGWQVQKLKAQSLKLKVKTIQETIEKVLKKVLQEKVKLIASGRTDSGVHALGQVANFKTKSKIPVKKLQYALNSLLPADISVHSVEEVALDFHSRYSAKSKVYRYIIANSAYPPALARNSLYFCSLKLNLKAMSEAAKALQGEHDFTSFCASASSCKDKTRTINAIDIKKIPLDNNNNFLIFVDIQANGFLYNMARNIIGTLLEVGKGRLSGKTVKKILLAKDRKLAGQKADAKGLCLLSVKYK